MVTLRESIISSTKTGRSTFLAGNEYYISGSYADANQLEYILNNHIDMFDYNKMIKELLLTDEDDLIRMKIADSYLNKAMDKWALKEFFINLCLIILNSKKDFSDTEMNIHKICDNFAGMEVSNSLLATFLTLTFNYKGENCEFTFTLRRKNK